MTEQLRPPVELTASGVAQVAPATSVAGEPAATPAPRRKAPSRTEEVLRAFHEEGSLGKAYDWTLVKELWPFMRPYRAMFLATIVVVLLAALGSLVRPLVVRELIDTGVLSGDPEVLMRGGIWLAALVLAEQLLLFIQIYAIQVVGARSMADLRRHVFEFLHKLRVGFFDSQPVGRLVTRVTSDVDAILELFASGALNAVGDLVRLLGIIIMMFTLDWHLACLAFVAVPPVALLVRLVRRSSRDAFREIRAKTARMNAMMNEQVTGMTLIQAYGRQNAAADEFDAINVAYRDANIRAIKYEALQDAAIEMVSGICLAAIIIAAGYRPTSFGTLVAFSAYLAQFFEPISALAQRYTLAQSAMAGAERVFSLLAVRQWDAPELEAPAAPVAGAASAKGPEVTNEVSAASAAFEFENVDFQYKANTPVLQGITLRARRGEKIALVGPTGSGKSTIVSLLLRLYDIDRGQIKVGGRDITTFERHALRRQFAIVPQDVFLFPGTVASNISAGETPDLARVEAALRRLDAWDIFSRREQGILATVDEHGANFSAGERQLIAFARAMYRDAQILILDEATASVDSETENRLQRALDALLKERTALVIAHRLSTIRAADRIVVLRRGQIVEEGSHEELVARGGLYARLHSLQFSQGSGEWQAQAAEKRPS